MMSRCMVVLFCALAMIVAGCQPKRTESLAIEDVHAREGTVELALKITAMSTHRAKHSVQAGLFGQFYERDISTFFPEIPDYDREADTVFWSYAFKPSRVALEGTTLTVRGRSTSDGQFWYCRIPKPLVDKAKRLIVDASVESLSPR